MSIPSIVPIVLAPFVLALSSMGFAACASDPSFDTAEGGGASVDVFLCGSHHLVDGRPVCDPSSDFGVRIGEDPMGGRFIDESTIYAGSNLTVIGNISSSPVEHQLLLEVDEWVRPAAYDQCLAECRLAFENTASQAYRSCIQGQRPDLVATCPQPGFQLSHSALSDGLGAADVDTAAFWTFDVAKPGWFQYRVSAVVDGSCTAGVDGDFRDASGELQCDVIAQSASADFGQQSLQVLDGCQDPTSPDCQRHDYAANVPVGYALDNSGGSFFQLCANRPTRSSCTPRSTTVGNDEPFYVRFRVKQVTTIPTLRVSLTPPGNDRVEYFSDPVTSSFELPVTERYGNNVNGYKWVWGWMQVRVQGSESCLDAGCQFDLLPKVYDHISGLTHFEHSGIERITVKR